LCNKFNKLRRTYLSGAQINPSELRGKSTKKGIYPPLEDFTGVSPENSKANLTGELMRPKINPGGLKSLLEEFQTLLVSNLILHPCL